MSNTILSFLVYLEPLGCIAALYILLQKRQASTFRYLTAFLVTRVTALAILLPVMRLSGISIERHLAYHIYFYVYWCSYAVEACLGFGIIYSLYQLAMAPLPGLRRLGMIMFRWAGGIAIAIAASIAFGPHVTSTRFIVSFVQQLQQTQSILTLCMLFFVTMAGKPMGLSHRSKVFGISLGLGVLATTDLLQSSWLPQYQAMASTYNLIGAVAIVAALSIWITYLVVPEPRRRMIILPTTSPFLRWNQISIALGDEPGFVAVGDVVPEMFAPAELEVMLRASRKIQVLQQVSLPSMHPVQRVAEGM